MDPSPSSWILCVNTSDINSLLIAVIGICSTVAYFAYAYDGPRPVYLKIINCVNSTNLIILYFDFFFSGFLF